MDIQGIMSKLWALFPTALIVAIIFNMLMFAPKWVKLYAHSEL